MNIFIIFYATAGSIVTFAQLQRQIETVQSTKEVNDRRTSSSDFFWNMEPGVPDCCS